MHVVSSSLSHLPFPPFSSTPFPSPLPASLSLLLPFFPSSSFSLSPPLPPLFPLSFSSSLPPLPPSFLLSPLLLSLLPSYIPSTPPSLPPALLHTLYPSSTPLFSLFLLFLSSFSLSFLPFLPLSPSPPSLSLYPPPFRLSHQIAFKDEEHLVLAKDASVTTADTYDIHDPRNPLNIRRRAEDTKKPTRGKGRDRDRTRN